MTMNRIATTRSTQTKVDSFFGNGPLLNEFNVFIEDPDNMHIIEKKLTEVKYIISRLVGRVPKSMHWDAMRMYEEFRRYTIDDFKVEVRYALMYRWYISLTHLRIYQDDPKISQNDMALLSTLLAEKDPIMKQDLKEVTYEVAVHLLYKNLGKAISNIVSTQLTS